MRRFPRVLAALFPILALAACATDRSYGTARDITVSDLTTLPAPAQAIEHRLAPLENVSVKVLQDDSLSGQYVVATDGTIDFPYIGPVVAGGRTVAGLAQAIADKLSQGYVVDPQVTVTPSAITPPTVSIGGEVEKPGSYPVAQSRTLLRAVNDAGGRTDYAKLDDVLIIREVDRKRYIGLYNLGAIQRGNYPDPELAPNDIVMVGDSPFRRNLANIISVLPLLSTSAILIDRLGK